MSDRKPEFTLKDLQGAAHFFDGTGPALICFVKEDCETCNIAGPVLQALSQAYGDAVRFLVPGQSGEKNGEFAQRHGLTMPVLEDAGCKTSFDWDFEIVPALYWIDESGAVVTHFEGFVRDDWQALSDQMARATGKAAAQIDWDSLPAWRPGCGSKHFDPEVYAETRRRVLSSKNEHYFEGTVLTGLGSPHTPTGYVWPLAVMVEALTSDDAEKRANALKSLLKAQCGNGLMHESVHHSEGSACTREWFEWANAMFVVLYEDSLRERCDAEAEGNRLAEIGKRETGTAVIPGVASSDPMADPLFYESLEAQIHFMT